MKKIVLVVVVLLIVAVSSAVRAKESEAPHLTREQQRVDMEEELFKFQNSGISQSPSQKQSNVPQTATSTYSVGVMKIDGSCRIPEVCEFFREVIVSELTKAGVKVTESLDKETLGAARDQYRLSQEGWLDPTTTPAKGKLHGVPFYLFGTVTRYKEKDRQDVGLIAGALGKKFSAGAGVQIWKGTLVADFRLVNATTGVVVDAFRTEAEVSQYRGGIAVIDGIIGVARDQEPLSEQAARKVARQCAERIAKLLNPQPAKSE